MKFNREDKDRIGEINYNRYGSKMTIKTYNNYHDIDVEFENGYIKKSTYHWFKMGNIDSPYDKSVYNIGYLGEGMYNTTICHKNTREYECWKNMIQRCYSKAYKNKCITYENAECCDEWLNFQNFSQWYNENFYEIDNEKMNLDKDILIKGNKIYSPDTCVFVSKRINMLFVKNDSNRGKYPIGVYYDIKRELFIAKCKVCLNNKYTTKYLGGFYKCKDAYNKYKQFKEKYIKQVAEEYKSRIPAQLYLAMYNWEVSIND